MVRNCRRYASTGEGPRAGLPQGSSIRCDAHAAKISRVLGAFATANRACSGLAVSSRFRCNEPLPP